MFTIALLLVLSPMVGPVGFATTASADNSVLYRANAGGPVPATDDGPNWVDDDQFIAGGDSSTANNPAPDSIDTSVPSYVPSGIWTEERYDPATDGELQYDFSVQSGQQVEVRLYFYDGFSGTSDPGDRVFDINVEGKTIEDFDPIVEYGDQTGGMKAVTVVSDGTIDVELAHVTENPQINAIEIVSVEDQPDTLGGTASVDFGKVVTGASNTEQVTLTNLGGSGDPDVTITDVSISGTDAGAFSSSFSGDTTVAPGESADVPVTFTPSDAQPKSATLEVSHTGSNSPLTVDLSGEGASDVPVGFGVSGLNVDVDNPTSLDFGPDGRLYVAQQNGEIMAYEITRNDANDYEVTDTEMITAVQNIPNHDDDGTYNPNVNSRQVTGLTVVGNASTPVLYVSSSDPRIGGGPDGNKLPIDTNSGVISRLTLQDDGNWDHDMLVRGLPRSEENHATNGVQYDPEKNVLYVAQGGHTNKGAPSNNFAYTPEYALSAAILSIDLDQINSMSEKDAANTDASYIYDLPTLSPESTPTDGPFGGQDGENMAKWVKGSPVDVYSPGWRNPYDIALNSEGQLYSTDNSANPGWGGVVVDEGPEGVCTNERNEKDESSATGVYHVDGEDYYGGHPNPTRGNPDSEFGDAVESGLHDPINCDYISPTDVSSESAALDTFDTTAQGVDVYEASNFGSALEGDLIVAGWNDGSVRRVELNADGTEAVSTSKIFDNIGNNPLDVHAQDDEGPFPGTVWAATYGSNDITVFEPNDYDGETGETCIADDPSDPDYDPNGDADDDGYTNGDENTVGTDPCSQASQPADFDQDDIPDALDTDDDNDGIPDTEDPFAIDAQNGLDNTVPVDRQFVAGQYPRSLFGLGFTGLMTNGTNYADLYNASEVRAGGATEKFSVDSVTDGGAYTDLNSQEYAFQYGIDAPNEPFVVRTTVEAPFPDEIEPEIYQSAGMQIGSGDQQNYIKLVASAQDANADPDGGVQFLMEEDGTVGESDVVVSEPAVFGSGQIVDLYLTVDPTTDPTPNDGSADVAVTAAYSINGGERVRMGETFAAPESWFVSNSVNGESAGTAVGLISTSSRANTTFTATWDRLTVTAANTNTEPTADAGTDKTVEEGRTVTLDASNSSDAEDDTLDYSWTQTSGPDVDLSSQDGTQPTFTTPDVDSATTMSFKLAVTDSEGATDTDTVDVTVEDAANGTTSGEATVAITADGGIDASTYGTDSFEITNTGDEQIESVTLDLGSTAFPDVVFDPAGTAGDLGAKGFTPDTGADTVGLVGGTFSVPQNGEDDADGYQKLTIEFDDFDPGETFAFSADNDPTSIKGATTAQSDEAGPISGQELSGARLTVSFADGATVETGVFSDGSAGGSQAVADGEVAAAPTIGVEDVSLDDGVLDSRHSAATVSSASQTITVDAASGETVRLLRIEGELNLVEVPTYDGTPGYKVEDYEANNAVQVEEYTVTVGSDGTATVPVTLTDSAENGGLNYFVAVAEDSEDETGIVSNVVVLDLAPGDIDGPPTVEAITDQGVTEGESITLDVPASDPAGDDLTYSVQGPNFVTVDADGTLTIAPGADAVGTYTVEVTVDDGSETTTEEFAVYVDEPDQDGTVVFAANAGGDEYTASDGTTYQAGSATSAFTGGSQSGPSNIGAVTDSTEIANTDDDVLYRTELYGGSGQNTAPNLAVPVSESGTYEVTLQFAEIFQGVGSDTPDSSGPTDGTQENDRRFSVTVEGQQVLTAYDIYSEVGSLTATDKTYTVEVTDGTLNVNFEAINDNAKLSAVKIERIGGTGDGPGPVGDFENAPTDPDGDGLYEDVNGDGTVNVGDAQALFGNVDDSVVQNNVAAFDFNGDGTVNVGDAQALFAETSTVG